MNEKWRIKKISTGYGTRFFLQKRLFGFLWWYNPDFFSVTGEYRTLQDAMEECRKRMTPRRVEIFSCSVLEEETK